MSSQGCSDGNCKLRIGPRPGQHTNGGCHCLRDIPTARRIEIERKLHSIKAFNSELLAAHDELARALFRIRSITIRKLDHIEVANIACDAVLHLDESPFFPAKATESEGER